MVGKTITKRNAAATLRQDMPPIFQECQKTLTHHRRYAASLRKLQEEATLVGKAEPGQPQRINLDGENAFNREFIRNLNKVLSIRKRELTAERIVKFVALFMQVTQEKDRKPEANGDVNMDDDDDEYETISSRFIETLLSHLLKGMSTRDKTVRQRCCQLVALSMNHLGEIDEDLYQLLKRSIYDRIRDKEAPVRMQAAIALSRLQGVDEEVDDEGMDVTKTLLYLLEHDSSSEVRRVVLFNLDQTKETLPYIIRRARDIDAVNRRAVFLKPMAELRDFRYLTIQQREQLLKSGVTDRDPSVKKACSRMLANNWIQHAGNNLLEFLERLDVVASDAAEDILTAFLHARRDVLDSLRFEDQFWNNLTIESAFLARIFIQFCQQNNHQDQLEKVLPEVTRLAFYIQNYNNKLHLASEDDKPALEFVILQLLEIARIVDYADEIGRRKMFTLLREILKEPDGPEEHLGPIVDIMRLISFGERDFTRNIIEIISDIREQVESDELGLPQRDSQVSHGNADDTLTFGTPRKKVRIDSMAKQKSDDKDADNVDKMLNHLRCLTISRYMLEVCKESLRDNASIFGLLHDIVIPAVQSFEVALRDEGLQCLGLCCNLDKNLAIQNFQLFCFCMRSNNVDVQSKALKVIFDIIMAFGMKSITQRSNVSEADLEAMFASGLECDNQEIQALIAEGLAKLMLNQMLRSDDMLQRLLFTYFDPETSTNLRLRQCLSYFFPAFCYSFKENQNCMRRLLVSTLLSVLNEYKTQQKNNDGVSPLQMAEMLIDWTDTRKLVSMQGNSANQVKGGHETLDLPIDVLKAICDENNASCHRVLCQCLPRLYLDDGESTQLRRIRFLAAGIRKKRALTDLVARKAFDRFEGNLAKLIHDEPTDGDEMDMSDLQTFLEEIQTDDDIEDDATARKNSRRQAKERASVRAEANLSDAAVDTSEDENFSG